MYKCFFPFLKV